MAPLLMLCLVVLAEDPSSSGDDAGDDDSSVVTAERTARPTSEEPASVIVLSRERIAASPALTTDELVRTVPSVATFRRGSSEVADPTSQGLNLRGVGPSGVSRGLLLVDGIPMNDPFGGFIYWRALPRLGLDRIEIVPSGGSALYGSAALGGTVQLFTRDITPVTLDVDTELGSQRTVLAALRGADAARTDAGDVGGSIELEALRSDGWTVVAPDDRGPVDGKAPSIDGNIVGTFAFVPSPSLSLGVRAGLFRELQSGGTTFTASDVTLGHAAVDVRASGDAGSVNGLVFILAEQFDQLRARVNDDRSAESLAEEQRVPADEEGASLVWTSSPFALLGVNVVNLGADLRFIQGVAHERLHPVQLDAASVVMRDSGGEQELGGLYVEDLFTIPGFIDITTAARADVWRNSGGKRVLLHEAGDVDTKRFPDRVEGEVSPRIGALLHLLGPLGVRGSLYRAFRAPTLNELYRPFQVGTVVTDANAALAPERLYGGEAGVELDSVLGATVHAVGFANVLEDPVTNVTLEEPSSSGATRQRENVGSALVRGLDAGVDWKLFRAWTLSLAYTWVIAEVTKASEAQDLVGKRLAQDPEHRAVAILTFDDPKLFTITLQVRAQTGQFEDDLNTLPMKGYALVDGSIGRRLFDGFELFAAADNIFNEPVIVGRAGVDTLGAPFRCRAGLRWSSP